jgi:hypothetical protein
LKSTAPMLPRFKAPRTATSTVNAAKSTVFAPRLNVEGCHIRSQAD